MYRVQLLVDIKSKVGSSGYLPSTSNKWGFGLYLSNDYVMFVMRRRQTH